MVWKEGVMMSYPIRKAKCGVLILVPSSARLHCVLRLRPAVQLSASNSGSLPSSTPCVTMVIDESFAGSGAIHLRLIYDSNIGGMQTDFNQNNKIILNK